MLRFRDIPDETVSETQDGVLASAAFVTGNGSILRVEDRYTDEHGALRISRSAVVVRADQRDLGFQTKISFCQRASETLEDFEYFSPGQWYRDNRYAAPYAMGKDMNLSYHWRKETYSGLPMFAMRHIASGESICLSRWAADATLPSLDRTATENYAYVDPKMTVGSFGVSKAKPEALTYTYYGFMMRTPLPDAPKGVTPCVAASQSHNQTTCMLRKMAGTEHQILNHCPQSPAANLPLRWLPVFEGFLANHPQQVEGNHRQL